VTNGDRSWLVELHVALDRLGAAVTPVRQAAVPEHLDPGAVRYLRDALACVQDLLAAFDRKEAEVLREGFYNEQRLPADIAAMRPRERGRWLMERGWKPISAPSGGTWFSPEYPADRTFYSRAAAVRWQLGRERTS
jgi:hypothetical protein